MSDDVCWVSGMFVNDRAEMFMIGQGVIWECLGMSEGVLGML